MNKYPRIGLYIADKCLFIFRLIVFNQGTKVKLWDNEMNYFEVNSGTRKQRVA